MKKTLIASAVAAAALSSNAFAMDPASDLAAKLDSMPSIYGNIQLAYKHETMELKGQPETTVNDVFDNGSTIGFKHDHEISEGVTGFFKAEFHFDADENGGTSNGGLGEKLDEAYIGMKGDFGAIQFGTDDTVYEWVDVIDYSEAVGLAGDLAGMYEGDNAQYTKAFGDVTVGATVQLDNDAQAMDRAALAAKYSAGDLGLIGAYTMGRDKVKGDTLGVAATYAIDDLGLALQYEAKGETISNAEDATDLLGFLASYSMGKNSFNFNYIIANDENGAGSANDLEQSGFSLGALHNLSDNAYVYVEYAMTNTSSDDSTVDTDESALAIGATYYF